MDVVIELDGILKHHRLLAISQLLIIYVEHSNTLWAVNQSLMLAVSISEKAEAPM